MEVNGPLSVEPTKGEKLARLLLGGRIGISKTLGVIGILVGVAGWGISISISFWIWISGPGVSCLPPIGCTSIVSLSGGILD